MTQEDKLRPAERVRLEALTQAVQSSGGPVGITTVGSDIIRRAKAFEDYIITGEAPR